MARSFNGTSDYLEHGAAVVSVLPITMACWFLVDALSVTQTFMSIGDTAADTKVYVYTNGPDNKLRAQSTNVGATSAFAATTSTVSSSGIWQHACGVFASTTDRRVFLNGAGKGTSATSNVLGTPTATTIGARSSGGVRGSFIDGLIAEPAIWDVVLTDEEVLLLALDYSPLMVRPASLKAYWPLLGRYSPEIDVRGGFDATVTGAAVADHPRMIYKRRRGYVFKPSALLQFARPDSDITPGNWTPSSGGDLFAMVDEETANDADRIRSNTGVGDDAVTLGLSDITTPVAGDVSITIRHRIGT